LNVGQLKAPVLAVRIQEQDSDIAIKRLQIDLGTSTAIYNKIFQNMYVLDPAGNVLATVPLNSTTVVQSGNDYITNVTIPSYVVKANTTADLIVAADVDSSIDTSYRNQSYTLSIPTQGVRGTDGSGTDQYGPGSNLVGPSLTINQSLTDNTIANVSLDSATPATNQYPVTDTTNGNYLQLPVLTFDINAQNDSVHIHNLAVNVTASGTGRVSAAYLYQGNTEVGSAAISSGVATFSNIIDGTAGANVPVNTTQPYIIKVDVTGVTSGSLAIQASTTASGTYLYNSLDETVQTLNGLTSTQGNVLTVVGAGPSFTILSVSPSSAISTANSTSQNGTSTATATFNVGVQATVENVIFVTSASSTKFLSYKVII
jgi:hypothetical protein